MYDIPECLNRRYRALDELIRELTSAMTPQSSELECPGECPSETSDAGIRLMCNFWNILKENPECDLPLEVQQRMNIAPKQSRVFRPQHIACYMAGKSTIDSDDNKKKAKRRPEPKQKASCCGSKVTTPTGSETIPLSKVLCNLKEAASFEKKCSAKVNKLMETQKELQSQIQTLENREQEGIQMLKEADCMWSCMEDSYKTKVAESLERQKVLMAQMKEVEASATKWRKNKKDLEFQLANISKCHDEIKEKTNQKVNDMIAMDMEIEDFKKRIQNAKKDTETAKKSLSNKRSSCDAKVAKVMKDIGRIQQQLIEERKRKTEKEKECTAYVKEAREDLKKMCKVLMRKKLEREDLLAEKGALIEEIEILKQTCDQCKEKCMNKQNTMNNELKMLDAEIADYKARCIRCHECTDTSDVRKLCTDCPRCKEERECLYEDDHCSPDHTMDCVCISIKQKFLDNVFDNMSTVLERQAKTGPGKAVADAVLNCLKRSRNGKLDDNTRKILQEFILTTVKKNLNLTIVGGAVKTRCEMDSDTYKQLMLCLKEVKVTQPPKQDKGTAAKKEPCFRWGGTSECNCPKGPMGCICTKKAPPPPRDPTPCPPPDKEDAAAGQLVACPHKENTACGPDCAMRAVPSAVGTDVAAWRPDPCKGQSCPFSKNMRAAQCVLGPESLSSLPKGRTPVPYVPEMDILDNKIENELTCLCGNAPTKRCTCSEDRRCRPRQRIIDEVMGRYTEISPIEKVITADDRLNPMASSRRKENKDNASVFINSISSDNKIDRCCSCFIKHASAKKLKTPLKVNRKVPIGICKNLKNEINLHCANIVEPTRPVMPVIIPKVASNANHVKVILCPKYNSFLELSDNTVDAITTVTCQNSKLNANRLKEKDHRSLDSYDASYVGRKVCDTVREIMKDIVIQDSVININETPTTNSEWVTLESLYNEIEEMTKSECPSNITLNEIEMSCEVLEITKEMSMVINKVNDSVKTNERSHKIFCSDCEEICSDNQMDIKVPTEGRVVGQSRNVSFNVSQDTIIVDNNCCGMNVKEITTQQMNNNSPFNNVCDVLSEKTNKNKTKRKCLRTLNSWRQRKTTCACNPIKCEIEKCNNIALSGANICNCESSDNVMKKEILDGRIKNCLVALSEKQKQLLPRNESSRKNSGRSKILALKSNINKHNTKRRSTK